MNMTLHEMAAAMNASLDQDLRDPVQRVSIDSRAVKPGDVFFCIVGQKLDGHEFAAQAVQNGACAVVASAPLELSVPTVLVRDTTAALGRLARVWRERARARVIGISGSAGKTTVKEMLAQVLATAGKTAKNYRNLNNQIGLPLSMLEMEGDEDYWVLELGISKTGDMDELGYILAPDAAVLVNIGACHLDGLGSLAGVAEQKSILLDHVKSGGFACVGADYPQLLAEAAKRDLRLVTFSGSGGRADYSCLDRQDQEGSIIFTLATRAGQARLTVPDSVHVPENVAAVTAMAMELGLPPSAVESGLAGTVPVAQRFVRSRVGSWVFIDDTYNANPVSMARSIREAERLARGRRLVLVLADMRELAGDSARAHRELGEVVAATSATHCFFHGSGAAHVQAGLAGFRGSFMAVDGPEDVLRALSGLREEGGVILFKGSRGCRMEEFHSFMERNWA